MNKIPKRFIRVWLGPKKIPLIFEKWWQEFKVIHDDYEFLTLTDKTDVKLPEKIKKIYDNVDTYAGQSDILRIIALYEIGGIYVDTDMMPLKKFDSLLDDTRPFIGLRSKVSFANGVIGGCRKDKNFKDVLNALPKWYDDHKESSASVQTGPAFVSNVWFGKKEINHLPINYFYPYNGFGQPKREERIKIFTEKTSFPKEMFAAHFGNHRWGGRPK